MFAGAKCRSCHDQNYFNRSTCTTRSYWHCQWNASHTDIPINNGLLIMHDISQFPVNGTQVWQCRKLFQDFPVWLTVPSQRYKFTKFSFRIAHGHGRNEEINLQAFDIHKYLNDYSTSYGRCVQSRVALGTYLRFRCNEYKRNGQYNRNRMYQMSWAHHSRQLRTQSD